MARLVSHCRPAPLRVGRIVNGLTLTLAIAAVLGIASYIAWRYGWGTKPQESINVITHVVTRSDFTNRVIEQGEVESSSSVEVRCLVKSRNSSGTAIIEVVPDGTQVEVDQVLVRLDSSALENEILQQKILTNNALALRVQAENDYQAALVAKREYLEGTLSLEEQTIDSERILAEEELRRARQYASYSERLAVRGYITGLQLEGDRFAVEKARNALETTRTKLRVLRDYTKAKMIKQFEAAIANSEARMKSETARYELERTNELNIADQISKCVIRAPIAGQVVHANTTSASGGADFVVEAGAMVRERQTIMRLPDPGNMQVKARVNESKIALVRVGQKANVRLSSFPKQPLEGEVVKLNEYPEPITRFGSQTKVYAAYIRIINPPANVRSGSSAAVQIQIGQQSDVVQVPVTAIFEHEGRVLSLVRSGEGYVPRAIELGASNDNFVVVTSGLVAGDVVVMNPAAFKSKMDFSDLPAATSPTRVAHTPAGEKRRKADDSAGGGP